jgi:FkbM family methyltransferase
VLAFEPQRILFQMLMGNLALNSVENVFAYHMALGREVSEIALPPVDYRRNWSFGGLGLGRPSPDPQFPGTEASALASLPAETVALRTIDSLSLPRADLIKLDVEGMEEDVLRGAEATIRRQRPIVFVEWLKRDGGSLPRYVGTMNYRLLQAGWNLLCVPEERADGFPVAGVTELKLETLD